MAPHTTGFLSFHYFFFWVVHWRPLGQTSPSSGIVHPIPSHPSPPPARPHPPTPPLALQSLPASSNIQHWGICPTDGSLLLFSVSIFQTGGKILPRTSIAPVYIREGFIHQAFWKILFQPVSLRTTFLAHGFLYWGVLTCGSSTALFSEFTGQEQKHQHNHAVR